MSSRRLNSSKWMWTALLVAGLLAFLASYSLSVARAQQPAPATQQPDNAAPSPSTQQQQAAPPPAPAAQQPAPGGTVLKSESRLVRVDVIVTGKKGEYITDLKPGDFKVFEDNKPQAVSSFSFGTDPAAPAAAQRHYMVLLFDDTTMDGPTQVTARQAAVKFIDANAGPDRVMAVMDFGGTMRMIQNFTMDATRLKAAVGGPKSGGISANPDGASAMVDPITAQFQGSGSAENDFAARTGLLAIRDLAKRLASIPGRKSLVLFTGGFPLTPETEAELPATIDSCNKANVAIYPLDVRGLVAPNSWNPRLLAPGQNAAHSAGHFVVASQSDSRAAGIRLAAFNPAGASVFALQHGGGGGGGGGGHGGGGGGGTGGGGGGGTGGGGGGGKGGGGGGGTGAGEARAAVEVAAPEPAADAAIFLRACPSIRA